MAIEVGPLCHLKGLHWDAKSDIIMFPKNKPSQILTTLSQFCVKKCTLPTGSILNATIKYQIMQEIFSLQRILIFPK